MHADVTISCYSSISFVDWAELLKVGSFSFECIIILLIYFINFRKHFLQGNDYVLAKSTVKSIRLAVMLGIP